MLYEFTIEYYYIRYHTGELNTEVSRNAIVFAENLDEAIKKIVKVDNNFICVANVSFKEIINEHKGETIKYEG